MQVYFIGAGPGDSELITIKGARIIKAAPIVLYTGSLVPLSLISEIREAKLSPSTLPVSLTPFSKDIILDSAGMNLQQIKELYISAHQNNLEVARVHTGDPCLYGSIAEQIAILEEYNIKWEVVPGVSSLMAGAAALGRELTLPGISQSVIVTRVEGRTPVPSKEKLLEMAKLHCTLAIFLSISMIEKIVDELLKVYPPDYPVAVVYCASWPQQKIIRGELANIAKQVEENNITNQAIVYVGKVLAPDLYQDAKSVRPIKSKLYDAEFSHNFRA